MNGETVTLPARLGEEVSDYIREQCGQLRIVGRRIADWLNDMKTTECFEQLAKDVGAKGNNSFAAHLFERAAATCEPWNADKAAELRQASEEALRRHRPSAPAATPVADNGSSDSGRDRFEQLQTLARHAGFEVEINPTRVVNAITGIRREAPPEGDPIRTYVEQGVGHPHQIIARLCTAAW
jgi:hypothetical protein